MMKAFWTRPCASCGKMIPKDAEMAYVNKKAYHPECDPAEQPGPTGDAHHFADSLGYIAHESAMGSDWTLRQLSGVDRESAGRASGEARGEQAGLFSMPPTTE